MYALYRSRKAAESDAERARVQDSIDALKAARTRYGTFAEHYDMHLPGNILGFVDNLPGTPLIVGGAVRDSFSGAPSKDYDIEVHGASMDVIVDTLHAHGYSVNEVGSAFGVLKVSGKGVCDIDVSVPRRENKTGHGHGHREFEVELEDMSVEEAASRRDFTFNAVMYDPHLHALIDPYNGRADFEDKKIRAVSDKFDEDPLRVLRAFQFAGRFGMSPDDDLCARAHRLRPLYTTIPVERVREEWGKFFERSTDTESALHTLADMEWDDTIPGLREALGDKNLHERLSRLDTSNDRTLTGSAVIASGMDVKYRDGFANSVLTGKSRMRTCLLFASGPDVSTTHARKHFAHTLSAKKSSFREFLDYVNVRDGNNARLVDLVRAEGIFDGPEPDLVSGNEVLELVPERKPGSWVRELLDELRARQYEGMSKPGLLDIVKNWDFDNRS